MAYITRDYYQNTFKGTPIPEQQFDRLADIASDLIDAIIARPIPDTVDLDKLARATAYQLELIHSQGGVDLVTGNGSCQHVTTEKLDEYSITQQLSETAAQNQQTIGGILVSTITLRLLRSMGLMSRWLYAGRGDSIGYNPYMPPFRHPF